MEQRKKGAASGAWGGTWDPATIGALFSLSGDLLTATRIGANGHAHIRGTTARTASASFGMQVVVYDGTAYPSVGLANSASAVNGDYLGANANSIGLYGSGDINWSGVGPFISTGVTYGAGDIITVVWDATTKIVFWKKNGVTIPGSAVDITVMGSTVYAALGAFQAPPSGLGIFT